MNFSFDERFSLLVDQEWTYRQNRRLARLLKAAKLRLPACVEDINYRQPRGLDRNLVVHLAACDWITNSQNVLITGPTGVGKNIHSLRSGPLRLSPRVQRAVLQSAAPPI